MKNNNYIKLNWHGKECLRTFLFAISGLDIKTSQMDYLWDKGIVELSLKYSDHEKQKRHEVAGKCLTDSGLETAKHYFNNL